METLAFELIAPEAVFFSGAASLVEAPGSQGDFGVLPGHMAFITTLRPGVVNVYDDKNAVTRMFIAGGLAEVEPGGQFCTVLAEQVVDLHTLTRESAKARLDAAKAVLENSFEKAARVAASQQVALAEALLNAL